VGEYGASRHAASGATATLDLHYNSGGPGSGLYRSTDGGATWKHLGVSVSGADSNRVYAMIEAEKGGLYPSDDGGDHWERVN